MTERKNILIDLDHVLSAAWPRDHMIGNATWDAYHAASIDDAPIPDMECLIFHLWDIYHIVGLTARPEKWRTTTMQWCLRHGISLDELLMRPDEAYHPAPEIKVQLARQRFPDIKNEVAFLIDDRDDVCEAFQSLGITVLRCFARRD